MVRLSVISEVSGVGMLVVNSISYTTRYVQVVIISTSKRTIKINECGFEEQVDLLNVTVTINIRNMK